ncbi:MAG: tetratricopeptide repeat protein, partial [Planctomycetota bacterium]
AAEGALAAIEAERSEGAEHSPQEEQRLASREAMVEDVVLTAYLSDQRWDDAMAILQPRVDANPEDAETLEITAEVQQARGDAAEVYLETWQRAYDAGPNPSRLAGWVQAVLDASVTADAGGSDGSSSVEAAAEAALAAVDAAVDKQIIADEPSVEMTRIRLLAASGENAEARERLAAAYPAAPGKRLPSDRQEVDQSLVAWYAATGDVVAPHQMRGYFAEEVERDNPEDARERWILGRYLLAQAQRPRTGGSPDRASDDRLTVLNDAIASLEEALALAEDGTAVSGPSVSDRSSESIVAYHLPLGTAYALAERWEEAVNTWEAVVAEDPGHIESLNNLAFVLADKLNRADDAVEYARTAYEAQPDASSIVDTYGYVLLRAGDPEQAEAVMRPIIRQSSPPEHQKHYGEILLALGREEEARKWFANARVSALSTGQDTLTTELDQLLAEVEPATAGPGGSEN